MDVELESWSPAVAATRRFWSMDGSEPRVRRLRVITLLIAASLVVLGVVPLVIVDLGSEFPTEWFYGWAGVAALSLPVGYYTRIKRNEHFVRTAKPSDAYSLYRTRMMIGLAIAEVPALAGLVISFPADSIYPYLAGLAVSLVRFAQHGPTATDVAQLQGWLDEFKDPFDLAAVLMEPALPNVLPPQGGVPEP